MTRRSTRLVAVVATFVILGATAFALKPSNATPDDDLIFYSEDRPHEATSTPTQEKKFT